MGNGSGATASRCALGAALPILSLGALVCVGALACGSNDSNNGSSDPSRCGAESQVCCAPSTCNTGLSCVNETCQRPAPACGAAGQACCQNSTCDSGLTCVSNTCQAPPAGISGTAAGTSFTARDAIGVSIAAAGSCPVNGLIVNVSNAAGTCALAEDACLGKKSLLQLQLSLVDTVAIGAATYEVVAPNPNERPPAGKFVVVLSQTDSSCAPVDQTTLPKVSGGSVAIASLSGDVATGSVDLTFEDGGTLEGPFTTTGCDALTPADGLCQQSNPPSCSGTLTCQ